MLDFNSVLLFGEYYGFAVGTGFFTVGPHDNVQGNSKNPERIMFNFETSEVKPE